MKKVIFQGLVILISFFSTWIILRQVDWVAAFKVEKAKKRTEEKLGELFLEIFKKAENETKDEVVISSVDSLVTRICTRNNLDRTNLKIHVLEKDEINAFALPNGHLIIYSGLISACENEKELSGVICHEIAHIELNHVMKTMVKEIGLSTLISISSGNAGSEALKKTAKMLSSSAFERALEKDADIKAVEYLIKANIDPNSLADFLYKLADSKGEDENYLSWISTHPDSKERAEYIIQTAKNKTINNEPVLTEQSWVKLKEKLRE
jgi:beta-barrel assembly-enhancing protease